MPMFTLPKYKLLALAALIVQGAALEESLPDVFEWSDCIDSTSGAPKPNSQAEAEAEATKCFGTSGAVLWNPLREAGGNASSLGIYDSTGARLLSTSYTNSINENEISQRLGVPIGFANTAVMTPSSFALNAFNRPTSEHLIFPLDFLRTVVLSDISWSGNTCLNSVVRFPISYAASCGGVSSERSWSWEGEGARPDCCKVREDTYDGLNNNTCTGFFKFNTGLEHYMLTNITWDTTPTISSIIDCIEVSLLKVLTVTDCNVYGTLENVDWPSFIGLKRLDLTKNPINGNWDHLVSAGALERIDLTDTNLTGSVETLLSIKTLKTLRVDILPFEESTTVNISILPNLVELYMNSLGQKAPMLCTQCVSKAHDVSRLTIKNTRMGGHFIDSLHLSSDKLTELVLVGNEFTGDVNELTSFTNLKRLILKGNWMFYSQSNIGQELCSVLNIKDCEIDLKGKRDLEDSIDFARYPSLEILNLNGLGMTGTIPKELGTLTKLKKLDLADNYLEVLEEGLDHFTTLEYLDLSGNKELKGNYGGLIGGAKHSLIDVKFSDTRLTGHLNFSNIGNSNLTGFDSNVGHQTLAFGIPQSLVTFGIDGTLYDKKITKVVVGCEMKMKRLEMKRRGICRDTYSGKGVLAYSGKGVLASSGAGGGHTLRRCAETCLQSSRYVGFAITASNGRCYCSSVPSNECPNDMWDFVERGYSRYDFVVDNYRVRYSGGIEDGKLSPEQRCGVPFPVNQSITSLYVNPEREDSYTVAIHRDNDDPPSMEAYVVSGKSSLYWDHFLPVHRAKVWCKTTDYGDQCAAHDTQLKTIKIRNTLMGGDIMKSLNLGDWTNELVLENTEFEGDISKLDTLKNLKRLLLRNNLLHGDRSKLFESPGICSKTEVKCTIHEPLTHDSRPDGEISMPYGGEIMMANGELVTGKGTLY